MMSLSWSSSNQRIPNLLKCIGMFQQSLGKPIYLGADTLQKKERLFYIRLCLYRSPSNYFLLFLRRVTTFETILSKKLLLSFKTNKNTINYKYNF